MTKEERLLDQRQRRLANGNSYTKKYEKTPNGFLMRLYRNMTSRITGVQKQKHHLYMDKELLPKEVFYAWAKGHPDFLKMFSEWEGSGYTRKLTPTVDRKESSIGYTLNNMQWLTHSQNSSKGARSKYGHTNSHPSYS